MKNETIKEPKHKVKTESKNEQPYCLILCNDEINSFDHVINVLIEVCKHDAVQAEQCAFIAHFKGECDVKIGTLSVLESLKRQMSDKGLTVEIDKL